MAKMVLNKNIQKTWLFKFALIRIVIEGLQIFLKVILIIILFELFLGQNKHNRLDH